MGVSRGGVGPPQPVTSPVRGRLLRRDQRLQYERAPAVPCGRRRRTMVDQNGATLAQPDMLTDYTFKTIFVAA